MPEAEDTKTAISMDLQDANLKDVLKILSIQSGLNFLASGAVEDRQMTLYLDKVSVKQAMDKLFKANNLTYELEQDSNIFIVKDWGKPKIETVTKIFYLKHATVSSSSLKEEMKRVSGATEEGVGGKRSEGGKWTVEEKAGITEAVKKLLSKYGSVIEDYRTNSLIVTDTPDRMPIVAQVIASLDIPAPQVMLEVEMLDVTKNTLEKIGLKFGDISSYPSMMAMTLTGAMRGTKFPFSGLWPENDTGMPDRKGTDYTAPGTLSFATAYQTLLQFIKTQNDTKYLARPRLLTLNNETAEIKIATDEVIGEVLQYDNDGVLESRSADRTETGISLRVTPQINLDTGEITMFINPEVKEAATSSFSSSYRDPEARGTKSVVRVKDGETVILGGLIRNEFSQTITKLPILGDLPLIGFLFRHKNKDKDKQRELLVFITPHIIKETDVESTQTKKVSLLEREQSLGLGFERQLAINTSLSNLEKTTE